MNWSEALLYLFTGIASLSMIALVVYLMAWMGGEVKGRTVVKALCIIVPIGLISFSIAGGLGVLE